VSKQNKDEAVNRARAKVGGRKEQEERNFGMTRGVAAGRVSLCLCNSDVAWRVHGEV
jgi:hypothetical protein